MDVLDAITTARNGSSSEKQQCYARLVGAEQWWLAACQQAIVAGYEDWLLLAGDDPLSWAWRLIADLCPPSVPAHPQIAQAIAIAARGVCLLRQLEHESSPTTRVSRLADYLCFAVAHWQHIPLYTCAPLSLTSSQVAAMLRTHTGEEVPPIQQLDALIAQVQQMHPSRALAALYTLLRWFGEDGVPPAQTICLPVLLDVRSAGLVADLVLAAEPDACGFHYADPTWMAFVQTDTTFTQALDAAWSYAFSVSSTPPAIRWKLTVRPMSHHRTTYLPAIGGASLGAGFAVGLLHLLEPQRSALDCTWAITGGVAPDGRITPVSGYPAKLDAAQQHGLRVIIPAAQLAELRQQRTVAASNGRLAGVATVAEASDILTRWLQARCPYHGLEALSEQDADTFAGRQTLIARILAALHPQPRLLAVLGPSGCGKSSLLQAGVIPHLRQGTFAASQQWQIILTRPADQPFDQLAASGLAVPDGNLLAAVQAWQNDHPDIPRLLLILDQFEEVLVSCSPALRQHFLDQLLVLLHATSLPVTVLLVMRDDFYSRLNRYAPDVMAWVVQALINIPPTLSREELLDIVQEPARTVGWEFAPGLADAIVQEVIDASALEHAEQRQGRSTLLPLLECALTRLWEESSEGVLTFQAYQATGGVTAAVTQWASATFEALPDDQRLLARRILTSLVHLGDEHKGLPDSRRRRPLHMLARHDQEHDVVRQVVQHLTQARLLVTAREAGRGEETVELIHETLVHEWSLLRTWLQEDRLFLAWRQTLEGRVQAWRATEATRTFQITENPQGAQAARRPGSRQAARAPRNAPAYLKGIAETVVSAPQSTAASERLLRGRELAEAEGWLQQRADDLSADDVVYIQASIAVQQQEQQARERHQQRKTMLAGAVALVLAVLLIGATVAGAIAWQQRSIAHTRLEQSESQRLAFSAQTLLPIDTELAVLLALEATRYQRNLVVEDVLHQTVQAFPARGVFTGHDGTVMSGDVSPDGQYLVTASVDRTARIWHLRTGKTLHILRGHENFVNDATFSPDGSRIVTASADQTVRLWDARTGKQIMVLHGHDGAVVSADFSPDGHKLVTSSGVDERVIPADRTARVWDAATGDELLVLRGHTAGVQQVLFSPDGTTLATISMDRTTRLWDVRTGQELLQFVSKTDRWIRQAMFHPDGSLLVATMDGRRVSVWNASTNEEHRRMDSGTKVRQVAFSPDGSLLLIGTEEGTVQIWDIRSGERQRILRGHTDAVRAIAFTPDGATLVTTGSDRTVRVWSMRQNEEVINLDGHAGSITQATFHPDGQHIVTAGEDGTTRVWDIQRGKTQVTIRGHTGGVKSAVYHPAGDQIATAGQDGTVRVWDARTGEEMLLLRGHGAAVRRVAYHATGRMLASVSEDDTVRLWDTKHGTLLFELRGHTGDVRDVAFRPDGHYLATVSNDYKLFMWATESGQQHKVWQAHQAAVRSVAWSPDGTQVATASDDQTVRLWNASTGTLLRTLVGHTAPVTSIAFSADGRLLASGSEDTTVRLWKLQSRTSPLVLRGASDGITSVAFSPDQQMLLAASQEGTCRVYCTTFDGILALAQQRVTRRLTSAERMLYLEQEKERGP